MPHIRSLVSSRRLRTGVAALLTLATFSMATLLPAQPVAAQTADSAVIINTSGYHGGPLFFYTTGHQLGNCNTVSNMNFSVNGGSSKTCTGTSMGTPNGMTLRLSSIPQGYTFLGFTRGYTFTNGIASCTSGATGNCFFNFDNGSTTVYANFAPIVPPAAPTPPSTPAAPTAPTLTIGNRTTTSIAMSWTTSSTPGGFSRYEVLRGGQVILTPPYALSLTNSGLTCATNYSYAVRVWDSLGRSATSNTVNTSTLNCPVASSNSSSSSSSSSSQKKTTTSTSQSSQNNSSSSSSNSGQTGTSSTSTTNDTLGDSTDDEIAFDDDDDREIDDNDSTDENAEEESNSGLTNLEKIVIGLFVAAVLFGLVRYIYARRSNNQDNYWS